MRKDFLENFSEVEASEIVKAEQELIKEGTPIIVLECVRELKHVVVEAPVEMGQIIVQDIAGTNVPVIATKKMGERV